MADLKPLFSFYFIRARAHVIARTRTTSKFIVFFSSYNLSIVEPASYSFNPYPLALY
nr:MAG TPA: hypothetical protein [Microviridae sp.]